MPEVTEREFQMLVDRVNSVDRKMEIMNSEGTRGVPLLTSKIQDLQADLSAHELIHEATKKQTRNILYLVIAETLAIAGQYINHFIQMRH
jgi:hypothetical protein